MILRDVRLSAPDVAGYCSVVAYRAGSEHDLATLRLVPGVKVDKQRRSLQVPVNCSGRLVVPPELPAIVSPSGQQTLRPYQMEGVYGIENTYKGFMLLDEVGLGKTPIACAYLKQHPELRPIVVVAPLIAMDGWVGPRSIALRHWDLLFYPVRTTTPDSEKIPKFVGDRPVDGYFVNYEILHVWQPWFLLQVDPRAVVVDEGHEVRNIKTRESKAVRKLCYQRGVEKRIWLTATPIFNNVIDLYNQLDCVQPGLWGPYIPYNEKMITSFGTRYASAEHDGYGWKYGGESNVEELRYRLNSIMVRHSRYEVRKDLPDLKREAVSVATELLDETAYHDYRVAAFHAREEALRGAEGERLTSLTAMSNSLSWAKRHVAVKHAEELAHSTSSRKIVVFCWYKRTAAYIAKALSAKGLCVYGPVTGQTSPVARLDAAKAFADLQLPQGGAAAYVATIASAGVALNPLSCASVALFVDLTWVPTTLIQAEGRVMRQGQMANQVLIRYLLVDDSIDTVMFKRLERKAATIEKALGDANALSLCESLGGKSEEETLQNFLNDLAALPESAFDLK